VDYGFVQLHTDTLPWFAERYYFEGYEILTRSQKEYENVIQSISMAAWPYFSDILDFCVIILCFGMMTKRGYKFYFDQILRYNNCLEMA